jgi:hypothetical protein
MKPERLLLAVALLASCTILPPNPPSTGAGAGGRPMLGISNGTPLAVALTVNGKEVGTATRGAPLAPIEFADLPPFPWTVEARSPSGRVLTTMEVKDGYVTAGTDPNGNLGTSGTMGRVDLSCGRITIWAGYSPPSGPPPPAVAGSPGDCAP